jgi:hypothetical protein
MEMPLSLEQNVDGELTVEVGLYATPTTLVVPEKVSGASKQAGLRVKKVRA